MVYYCIVHNTVVPRLIRNKSLPINLAEMTKKKRANIVLYMYFGKKSRRIITDRYRKFSEYSTKTTHARRPVARTRTQQKEGEIGRTRHSYHGRMRNWYGT